MSLIHAGGRACHTVRDTIKVILRYVVAQQLLQGRIIQKCIDKYIIRYKQ
jgi:hypothetical protein